MSEKLITRHNTHCIINYRNIQSKLTFPTQEYNFYLVGPHEDTDYEWYDNINSYCIEKNPTEEKILTKLYKYIDKQNIVGIKKYVTTQITQNSSSNIKPIDSYDVSYYRMKEKITNAVSTSVFLTNEFAENPKIKSIYNEKILANILVEEYLKCWENAKQFGMTLELINDNVFSWKLKFNSFSNPDLSEDLKKMSAQSKLGHIEVDILFHGKLYPNYPPVVRIVKPTLLNQISHRISNSKMIQLSYWTPSRSVMYIIGRLQHLLNTWGRIDFGESIGHVEYSQTLLELENNLQKLSSFIDPIKQDDEIDADEEFISFNVVSKTVNETGKTTTKTTKTGWKAGTGYGTSGSSNWDPKEFYKLQAEKDANIAAILAKIIDNLYGVSKNDYKQMAEIVENSLLISYLKQQFTSVSLLDVKNRLNVYKLCFNIISELIHEETMNLFAIKYENSSDNLYDVLLKMHEILKITQSINTEDEQDDKEISYLEFETTMLNTIEVMLIPLYEEFQSKMEQKKSSEIISQQILNDVRKQYHDTMSKLRFKHADIINTNFKPDFKKAYESALNSGANFNNCKKRLRVEIPTFKQEGELPIDYDSSIFVRVDESTPMIIRMLVTGPKDTPYDSSCMIFDFYTPETYPATCPMVKFMNHGNKRFNPNLYNCGKVCLSILGQSYVGPSASASEKWNETSRLTTVMISIQSQILIEDPYFNEPGYETNMGTATGDQRTKAYNENIRQYVMDSAMLALLENPKSYPQFEEVIINHFKLKRDYISNMLDKWVSEAMSSSTKSKMLETATRIKTLMNNL